MNRVTDESQATQTTTAVPAKWGRALSEAVSIGLKQDDADRVAQLLKDQEDLTDRQLNLHHETFDSLKVLNADSDVILTALLFQSPEIRTAFKPNNAQKTLFEGQAAAQKVWDLHDPLADARKDEGLRSLLLALVKDLRVVLILLSRQLGRMRLIAEYSPDERKRIVELTRDMHAPLANRLGIWQLKWELEDLVFRNTQPDTYLRIAKLLDEKRKDRENYIREVTQTLQDALKENNLNAQVVGRPKHIYSIWKKMSRKDAAISDLYDLRAVRILVDDLTSCYAALGVVHSTWTPIPSEFDDYIARPKLNDYRSLHTAVIGPQGKTLEIQIRTQEMHERAELGVAAHWRYKEGSGNDAALDRKIAWMRQLLEQSPEELSGGLKEQLVEDRIYVLTPKGEVVDLPVNATPLDFAYHVHTEVGHRTRGAKVNGSIVTLDTALNTGDRVEILTGKISEPRRDWLVASNGFLVSSRSRSKVRAWFHKLDRDRNLLEGKEMLDKELRRVGLLNADLKPILSKFNCSNEGELLVLIALGDFGPSQVARALQELTKPESAPTEQGLRDAGELKRTAKPSQPTTQTPFIVGGVGNLLVQIAKCCQPVRGEPIIGYLTKGRGITVHRPDCASVLRLQASHPERVLAVDWGESAQAKQEIDIQIDAQDRKWLLKDISDTIAASDAHVLSVSTNPITKTGSFKIKLRLRVKDFGQLSVILAKIAALPGVHNAFRR